MRCGYLTPPLLCTCVVVQVHMKGTTPKWAPKGAPKGYKGHQITTRATKGRYKNAATSRYKNALKCYKLPQAATQLPQNGLLGQKKTPHWYNARLNVILWTWVQKSVLVQYGAIPLIGYFTRIHQFFKYIFLYYFLWVVGRIDLFSCFFPHKDKTFCWMMQI